MNMTMAKIRLANLPTPIEKLRIPSLKAEKTLYIKRDDQTGLELSGNKVRKLEFALAEAIGQDCDTIITAGALQSNHCRATAAACARLGLRCILILSSDEKQPLDGNYLLDHLFGARVLTVSTEKFHSNLPEIMKSVKEELEAEYRCPYLIPVGASNGIGTFGYFSAFDEILAQEKEMGLIFDCIVCTVGSGGTYAGLALANQARKSGRTVVGFNITADREYFEQRVLEISREFMAYSGDFEFSAKHIHIVDGYKGRGYGLSTEQELSFLREFASSEGILLDPVYTGKAMRGLIQEIRNGHPLFQTAQNILFIHTGGLFGLFPKRHQF